VSVYSAPVLEHFRNPRGPGRLAARAGARVVSGEARASAGGQRVRLHLELADGRIARARFQAFGCPVTIALASAAVERLEGAVLADARGLSAAALATALELDAEQRALADLPVQALAAALAYPAPRP